MKVTQNVLNLMFELSTIEGEGHARYLCGEGAALRNNLLELYKLTKNPESHEIIIDIMSEAGYPWFGALVRMGDNYMFDTESLAAMNDASNDFHIMSEDDFLELIPANGHFH